MTLRALDVQDAGVALGGDRLPGDVLGQIPVDRAALVGHQVRELAQRLGELLRVAHRAERAQPPAGRSARAEAAASAAARRRARRDRRIRDPGAGRSRREAQSSCAASRAGWKGPHWPSYPGSDTAVSNRASPGSPWAQPGGDRRPAAGGPVTSRGDAAARQRRAPTASREGGERQSPTCTGSAGGPARAGTRARPGGRGDRRGAAASASRSRPGWRSRTGSAGSWPSTTTGAT